MKNLDSWANSPNLFHCANISRRKSLSESSVYFSHATAFHILPPGGKMTAKERREIPSLLAYCCPLT